jgi:hypothetical protein
MAAFVSFHQLLYWAFILLNALGSLGIRYGIQRYRKTRQAKELWRISGGIFELIGTSLYLEHIPLKRFVMSFWIAGFSILGAVLLYDLGEALWEALRGQKCVRSLCDKVKRTPASSNLADIAVLERQLHKTRYMKRLVPLLVLFLWGMAFLLQGLLPHVPNWFHKVVGLIYLLTALGLVGWTDRNPSEQEIMDKLDGLEDVNAIGLLVEMLGGHHPSIGRRAINRLKELLPRVSQEKPLLLSRQQQRRVRQLLTRALRCGEQEAGTDFVQVAQHILTLSGVQGGLEHTCGGQEQRVS